METVKEKVERYKGKAEVFLKNNTKAFIINTSGDYFFCNIMIVGEDYLYVQHFTGKKKGEKERVVWFDIIKFEEYEEKEDSSIETKGGKKK